ncbi:hypothetical protein N7509_003243 [Penicillium cosmopolitanum]|uniref:Importin N-terminal domain-containing protein n=1 Tax=Penicillium cosmopolitanum TaxID=1131564 RepID=A0A9W9W4U5_9EURO|nr:uncharacterized protein N7509_003243 [Penicillium cosmopolitanum]KAJ5403372.1 hypothetical protein N7509_003243 [Penicillium cosmopolitanum]
MVKTVSIEVPGESNPLSLQNVVNSLVLAASSSQQQVQTGTKQLQNWERIPAYHAFLQDVFLDHSAPNEVRYLSIIQLKNGIDKYWRRTAAKYVSEQPEGDANADSNNSAIEPDEKQKIKTRALDAGIVEPSRPLALQNALMIAKIMRYEFPQDWPDAMNAIINSLRNGSQPGASPLQLPRTLLILLQVIKELSTARIQRTRTHLASVTPEIFQVVGKIYMDKVNQWAGILEHGGSDEGALLEITKQSLISLKVLRRLMISGFEHPGRDQDVQHFWEVTNEHLSKFLAFVDHPGRLPESVHTMVEKHVLQLSKLHVEMARNKPASFALFSNSIALVNAYWAFVVKLSPNYVNLGSDAEADGQSLPEKTALRALLLIRACSKMAFNPAQTFKYQTPEDKAERKDSVDKIKSQLFTQEFVVSVMELIVTHLFRLRNVDFQEWEEDPESWEKREVDADAWEYSVHSCSEKLFLDLVTHFKDWLISPLLNVFQSFATTENKNVMLKESLYSAIGLAAASLEQHLDINAFLQNTMIPEVQIQEQEYRLLRRRIALVLGQWVPIKFADMNMESVYQIFQHLLNKDDPLNDLVVRITAGRQLCNILDTFDFKVETFLPFAQPILASLMSLMQEVELSDTKMALLESVRVIVVKMEQHVVMLSDSILSPLPQEWEKSGEEHLLKQAILTLLTSLIHSMNQESVRYHPMILPLIQSSIDTGSETYIYLMDEALELWAAVMMQTPSPPSPEILSLFPALFPILEDGADSVAQALEIVESYVLLSPQTLLSDDIRSKLLYCLHGLLEPMTKQRSGVIPRLVERLIRGVETVDGGSETAYNAIAQSLLETNMLQSLLKGLYSAHEASQTTGPNRKRSDVDGKVETEYFSAIARLALANPTLFASAATAATYQAEEELFTWLLTEWFFHYDNIASASQKKLHFLQDYLTVWNAIVVELAEGGTDENADYLVCWNAPAGSETAQPESSGVENAEDRRRREWNDSDATHRFPIRDFVRHRLHEVIAACGGAQRFQEEWLVNVDSDVVSAFGGLGLI